MKKSFLFVLSSVVLVGIIGGIAYMILTKDSENIGTFDLSKYSYYIENFPSDKVLGAINSSETAEVKAEAVWVEIYGEAIRERKPYDVSFDDENQVWLVQGSLPKNSEGGVPHLLIQKSDGKVLAVWHDK